MGILEGMGATRKRPQMRFASPEHLATWKATGAFPVIHDEIFGIIMAEALGQSFCDLGSCYGLLMERLQKAMPGATVVGIEADPKTIEAGKLAGVRGTVLKLAVDRITMTAATEFMSQHNVTVLVARRVFPEIWGEDLDGGREFARLLYNIGVSEIFLQGRLASERTVNSLGSVDREVALVSDCFSPVFIRGQIAYLRRKRT